MLAILDAAKIFTPENPMILVGQGGKLFGKVQQSVHVEHNGERLNKTKGPKVVGRVLIFSSGKTMPWTPAEQIGWK